MSRIARVRLDEVIVPARPDSINSPEVDHPLHKLPNGAACGWTQQFDLLPKIIIRLDLDDGTTGLGETYRAVPLALAVELARTLLGVDVATLSLQDLPLPRGRVYDGFECAIVDAVARGHGLPLHALLGGAVRDRVRTAYWTGHRTTPDAVRLAKAAHAQGFDCIKFKCRLDDPVVQCAEQIADAVGPALRIVFDPNERFETAAAAGAIAAGLGRIGNVLYLEDPIPRWDLEAWRHLRARSPVPLALHISLPYLEMGQVPHDGARAVRAGACDYFNLNGGIYAVRQLSQLADLFDMPHSHGSELDLGILEASYIHKAAAGRCHTLPSDIFGRLVREHDLLETALRFEAGHVMVPTGPGLGVQLSEDALARYRTQSWSSEA